MDIKETTTFAINHGFVEVNGGFAKACGRCGGTGVTVFHWVDNGRCFDCGGARYEGRVFPPSEVVAVIEKREKARAARQAKAAAEAAKKSAAWMAQEAERAAAEAARNAARRAAAEVFEFVANEGEKVEFDAEVTFKKYIEPQRYGFAGNWMVIFKIDETHEVKTFSAAKAIEDVEVGQKVHVVGVVKKNEAWEGKKVSQIARPKVTEPQMALFA